MQVFARLPKSAISTTLKTDLLNAFEWNVSPEETTVIAGKQTDTLEFSLFCIALVSLFEIELSKALLEEYAHNCIGYYIAREWKNSPELDYQDLTKLIEILSYALPTYSQKLEYKRWSNEYLINQNPNERITTNELDFTRQVLIDIWSQNYEETK